MVFLCFLATAINFIDRANLSVAAPVIQRELNFDDTTKGLILGAFFWTYALFQMPGGYMADRIGVRITYAFAVIWWSIFTSLTALGRNVISLFAFRLGLGIGEAAAYPSNAKVVGLWFPRRERVLAASIFDSGTRVGTAVSLPIVTYLILTFGWRASFVVTGTFGLIWVVLWLAFYRDPNKSRANAAELEYIRQDGARIEDVAGGPKIRWVDLFRYRTIWGMMLGFFCLNFVIYFFITWFPSYLVSARHFSLPQLGAFGSIPALIAIPGGWLGGLTGDYLYRRGWSLTRTRKTCLVGGMLVSSVVALAAIAPTVVLTLTFLSISYASLAFTGASIWSLPSDVAPTPAHVASIAGIQNFASNLAGILMTFYFGYAVQHSKSYVIPLSVAGALCIVGALSYLFLVGRIEPLPRIAQAPAHRGT
jgi:ACS family D-galactonate transporter-like MFS transporter